MSPLVTRRFIMVPKRKAVMTWGRPAQRAGINPPVHHRAVPSTGQLAAGSRQGQALGAHYPTVSPCAVSGLHPRPPQGTCTGSNHIFRTHVLCDRKKK